MKKKFVYFQAELNRKMTAVGAVLMGAVSAVLPGYCSDLNSGMNNFLEQMWKVMTFTGIIMAGLGVASLVRTIGAIASGEQAQPGALGKGLGLLIGGIALAALKSLLGTLGIATSVA